ncbi:FecR family protein [Dyadobacter chenwenxiniae]|uniref:FecR family protein n=1 Tax=Dyadobacter chenwenxiniae TaxID=2906456 RepID=A0A9X1PFN4_9BACT|nr:FecR family protein [Dyadobacter chenwenxiniae]MCF0060472.1 FecR family protein [Dyadobacter chenwenxiniae]UON86204.1 FecR family protein [Dyadobacter chenwenxiniae]
MRDPRLDDLFYRYCEKKITDDERDELMSLLMLEENQAQINGLIDQFIRDDDTEHRLSDETADDILQSIFSATAQPGRNAYKPIQEEEIDNTRTRPLWIFKLVAAAVVLLLVYGGYHSFDKSPKKAPVAAMSSVYGGDVKAGGNKASLTLANGETFDLATITQNNLQSQPGTMIDKDKGEITYNKVTGKGAVTPYNILRTPLGGQYKIVLPDGSRAWLNAASSLKYPTAFTGTHRNVEMSGEVYFEIEPNKKMPFQVKVTDTKTKGKDMEITVLGTHFNISSYGDEPTMQTTLLEGSVRVKKDNVVKVLRPGQQAQVVTGEPVRDIAINKVDPESVVAWKEGRFEFNGNIREIMRQISRWYDLDVKYEGDVERKSFAGTISRKNNVSEVLKMLELTGGIQFRIEDRKITVKNTD